MYKNVLESIAGIEIYPIISFLIFFIFFITLTLYAIFSDKNHIAAMGKLPLKNDDATNYGGEPEL